MEELITNLAYETLSVFIVVGIVVVLYGAIHLKLKRQESENEENS